LVLIGHYLPTHGQCQIELMGIIFWDIENGQLNTKDKDHGKFCVGETSYYRYIAQQEILIYCSGLCLDG